jgi:hypothetical protein
MFLRKRRVLWLLLMVFAFAVMAGGCGGGSGGDDYVDPGPTNPDPVNPDPVDPDPTDPDPNDPDPPLPPTPSGLVQYPIDGLRVECVGITGYTDMILVEYIVTAENADTQITIGPNGYSDGDLYGSDRDRLEIYEPDGSRLKPDRYSVNIAGELTARRLIVRNTPTSLVIRYMIDTAYAMKSSYSKVELFINDHDVIFQNVPGASANPSGFVKYPEDGIRVECTGIKRYTDYIAAEYLVTAENADTQITIGPNGYSDGDLYGSDRDRLEIYEPDGSRLKPDRYSVYIAGELTARRLIVRNTPASVVIRYSVGTGYALKASYPRVELVINGHDVLFQNVPASAN